MENFKKLIEAVNCKYDSTNERVLYGTKELVRYDDLIKKIFKNEKITYIDTPQFLVNEDGDVVFNNEEGKHKSLKVVSYKLYKSGNNEYIEKFKQFYILSISFTKTHPDISVVVRFCGVEFVKIKKTFTISENIFDEFAEIADRLAINKSKFVENKIVEFINKNK